MYQRNIELLNELRKFDLPEGEYLVIASGSLGVRHIREMKDVDIKVTDKLWDELSQDYEIFYDDRGIMKLRLSDNIEAMFDASFPERNEESPKIENQLSEAEAIDGLPFENIMTTLSQKKLSDRPKNKKDVELIEKWLEVNDN